MVSTTDRHAPSDAPFATAAAWTYVACLCFMILAWASFALLTIGKGTAQRIDYHLPDATPNATLHNRLPGDSGDDVRP